jgi:hypothetical protein
MFEDKLSTIELKNKQSLHLRHLRTRKLQSTILHVLESECNSILTKKRCGSLPTQCKYTTMNCLTSVSLMPGNISAAISALQKPLFQVKQIATETRLTE